MATILKIEKLQYLQNRLANFAEILYDDTLVLQSLPAVQKITFLKIQDGCHFVKCDTIWPILMTFRLYGDAH